MKYELRLGYSFKTGQDLPWITDIKERASHIYMLGLSGMGKSTLLEQMALYDANFGCSVFFIDPKGDSVRRIYNQVEDKSKIIYISINHPSVAINPLRKDGYDLNILIDEFVQIIDIVTLLITPNVQTTYLHKEILYNAISSFSEEQRELEYLNRFLMYEKVRKAHIKGNMAPELLEYWIDFDARNGSMPKHKEKQEAAGRVATRISGFLADPKLKKMIVGKNNFDFTDIIENGKVVLVDTSNLLKDRRAYLTNLLIYGIYSYMQLKRKRDSKPLMCYIDEFEIVVSDMFTEILAMARSAGIGFTIAHHNFKEISQKMVETILGTVNNYIVFRSGETEAKMMAETYTIKKSDFLNLAKYQAWARLGTSNIDFWTFKPLPDIQTEPEIIDIPETPPLNFLRDDWFSC